ncbi:MAG: ATP-binding protein [Candidatus Binatus sp.]|uniref:sensor histidine kinase n=1 Tax=Candidatus Binatus sp. TaxID=2811406 RepID=UPI002728711B|nr:ATP-binding protein [Candidatus Binatus sp.]MDO8434389.1 ATP-binding protein [Candidatus Binatus sp.]
MTIRARLTLYWAIILATILCAVGIIVLQLFEHQQLSTVDAGLLEEADTTAKEIERAGRKGASAILEALSRETDIGPGRRVRLIDSRGVAIDYGNIHTIPPSLAANLPTRPQIVANGSSRFAVAPLELDGQPAYVESGVNARLVHDSVDSLRASLILILPVVLILCVAGGYWLAGRALRPMESVTAALAAIHPNNLDSRLTVAPVADEIARLSSVINALLERLERASATERRFASDAAHELRTPLAVLRTGLEVTLAKERSERENLEALNAAHREVLALCKIADELLMLARLNGEVAVNRERLDLSELAAEVASTVEPLADAHEVELRLNAPEPVPVEGNRAHLRRLLVNLLDNALKLTPARGWIEVAVAGNGAHASLSVADSGPPIPDIELPFIFDRFFRGAASPGEGSGLGLSLCKEIARIHGGEIVAANRAGGGCEFVVTLPAVGKEAPAARAAV